MMLKQYVKKYYNRNLTFTEGSESIVLDSTKLAALEEETMRQYPFGDDCSNADGKNDFAVLDNVNTLKNLMAFAEITRYKQTLLSNMTKEERNEVTAKIINNLDKFEVKPVGYEITENSIIVAWYLNPIINTFTFSNQSIWLTQ